MKEFLKRHQAAIVVSIISTCFVVYFLKPILDLSGRVLMRLMVLLGTKYLDCIYSQVALLTTHEYSFLLLILAMGFGTAFILGLSTALLRHRFFAAAKREEDKPGTILKVFRSKFLVAINFALALLVTVGFFIVVVGNYTQLSLISSLNQHFRIIAPYIDEQVEEEILSEWSRMTSKADFDRVYKRIHALAQANGAELPPNRIYSPYSI
ncbi:MAG: hypothetical protein ISS81_08120 [Candidatus Marinimicrobia bacterium]|nr:hypothetical protein [Candidatus Neomarinimicrobiota bacterium]